MVLVSLPFHATTMRVGFTDFTPSHAGLVFPGCSRKLSESTSTNPDTVKEQRPTPVGTQHDRKNCFLNAAWRVALSSSQQHCTHLSLVENLLLTFSASLSCRQFSFPRVWYFQTCVRTKRTCDSEKGEKSGSCKLQLTKYPSFEDYLTFETFTVPCKCTTDRRRPLQTSTTGKSVL